MTPAKVFIVMCLSDIVVEGDRNGNRILATRRTVGSLKSDQHPNYADLWTTQRAAERDAERRAQSEPTKVFTVLETVSFIETTTPDVLHKTFNEAGEYVLKQQAKAKPANVA